MTPPTHVHVGDGEKGLYTLVIICKSIPLNKAHHAYTGALHNPNGPTFQAVAVGASGDVVRVLYTSPVLNNYSYDHYTGYSPPIHVRATGMCLSVGDCLVATNHSSFNISFLFLSIEIVRGNVSLLALLGSHPYG